MPAGGGAREARDRLRRWATTAGPQWRETHGEDRTPVLLFGAGPCGTRAGAGAGAFAFSVRWFDEPAGCLSVRTFRQNATAVRCTIRRRRSPRRPPDAFVLVMTHDHPLDLAITAAALRRGFPYVGLIGSATKRARFEKRFREIGIAAETRSRALVCPIGLPGIADKDPAIIAASVTAQLLRLRERRASNLSPPLRSLTIKAPHDRSSERRSAPSRARRRAVARAHGRRSRRAVRRRDRARGQGSRPRAGTRSPPPTIPPPMRR